MTATLELHPRRHFGFWLLLALLAFVGVEKAIHTPLDPDLFWHLRVADQLRTDGIGPIVDRISFASIKTPWTPYSWLAELGMKTIWDTTGYRGALAILALTNAAILVLIALSCLQLAGPQRYLNTIIATAIAGFLTLPYLSFRPTTFAFFWLSVCTYLLLRDRRLNEQSRAVWLIVPITALLANIHLLVIVAPLAVACLFAGSVIERRNPHRYALLLLATIFASLLTPMLPGVIRTAWYYNFQDVMVDAHIISENSPIWSGTTGIITCALIAALLIPIFLHRNRIRAGEWLWLLLGAAMVARLGRFAPVFAMIFAPIVATTLTFTDSALQRRVITIPLVPLLAVALIRVALDFPARTCSLDDFLTRDQTFKYPSAAANYVDQHIAPRHHRLICEFTWGGYLGWRLRDHYQVLLDGRTQLYSPEFWRSTYLCDDPTKSRTLSDTDADVAILPKPASRFRANLQSLNWKLVYDDDRAQVWVPQS